MIIMHFHFSNLAFFMQRTNLVEILPIHCIQKLTKLFSFCLKQMLWQSHVYFRIHQLQSVPTPIKLRNHEPEHFRVATFHIFNKTVYNHFSFYLYWTKGEQTSKKNQTIFNKTVYNHFSFYLYWTKGEQTSKKTTQQDILSSNINITRKIL